MVAALLGTFPAVLAAKDTPRFAGAVAGGQLETLGLFLEFLLRELAAHAAVIGDLDRLVATLDPFRNHGLDIGPGADGLHEHALRFVVFGLCHDPTPCLGTEASAGASDPRATLGGRR